MKAESIALEALWWPAKVVSTVFTRPDYYSVASAEDRQPTGELEGYCKRPVRQRKHAVFGQGGSGKLQRRGRYQRRVANCAFVAYLWCRRISGRKALLWCLSK